MNGIHDMGGMHGFGRVRREEDEPVFHEPWEGRIFAMQVSGMVPLFPSGDAGRYALEQLDPAECMQALPTTSAGWCAWRDAWWSWAS